MIIGRTVRVLEDTNRKEIFSKNHENRKIVVSIFYPADGEWKPEQQAYYKDLYSPCEEVFIERYKDDDEEISEEYLNNIKINSYNDAPIAKGDKEYPLIIFSPGFGMGRDTSMFNVERLVHEGYIVITIGHTYDTTVTIFPDGNIIEQTTLDFGPKYEKLFEKMNELKDMRENDISFVIDELKELNKNDSIVKGKISLNKIGVLGHSLGGAAVMEAGREDTRIKAVAMLDGAQQYFDLKEDIQSKNFFSTPVLNFRMDSIDYKSAMSEYINEIKDELDGEEFKQKIVKYDEVLNLKINRQKELYDYLSGDKMFIKLHDAEHHTFTDRPILLRQEYINGKLKTEDAHRAINEVIVRFFEEYLLQEKNDLNSYIANEKLISSVDV
ncbi:alpha/beta hydrolase family protein [Oceanirhabdus sp. W0125-5]|uniref:alpha/beta hydrolase family protein n=1 Tax=Oceanirhabdus sp. W0125-5 TaxID=2999116 RepID=UPI0022F2FBFF|nr:hypothetical protein [Oceanirhabdus sp. W0125-5]WBW96405.1 hypothetical protein OW730_22320 [Oceanirhabdus sp. W0125-5]